MPSKTMSLTKKNVTLKPVLGILLCSFMFRNRRYGKPFNSQGYTLTILSGYKEWKRQMAKLELILFAGCYITMLKMLIYLAKFYGLTSPLETVSSIIVMLIFKPRKNAVSRSAALSVGIFTEGRVQRYQIPQTLYSDSYFNIKKF